MWSITSSNTSTNLQDRIRTFLRGAQRPLRRTVLLSVCIALVVFWNLRGPGHFPRDRIPILLPSDAQKGSSSSSSSSHLPCWSLAGGDSTLVIMRTGSTELVDRLTVHLSTSFRCFPHYMIFSDLSEEYLGEHIHDALQDVSPSIRATNQDFELYRRLQAHGRAGLAPSELSGSPEAFARPSGNAQNPGWKLDKWKFMPMVNKTFHEHPDMKWYVFIEADAFLLWSMLHQYLATLDSTQPIFAGHQMFAGSELFAHGGAGIVASQSAMRLVSEYYAAHKSAIESFTHGHWAGDCVLGKYFREAGVVFRNAFPHFQGDFPGLVAYAGPDGRSGLAKGIRERCYPTVSYHHMAPEMVRDLWEFEQKWMEEHDPTKTTLRHWDIFQQFVRPRMLSSKDNWDNLSDQEEEEEEEEESDVPVHDVEGCRARCASQPKCRQFSFRTDGSVCKTRVDPRLGVPANGTHSDWIQDRVDGLEGDLEPCRGEGWI